MMKNNGSIERLWTFNGFVYFKYKDGGENSKKVVTYEELYDYFPDDLSDSEY